MQYEHHAILNIMADGGHRSFDLIQIMTQMDSVTLQITLKELMDAGCMERDTTRGEEAFVITLRGLIEQNTSASPPPLYRV